MTYGRLFRNTMIGLLLASLPLGLCFGIAELIVTFGIDLADVTPRQAQQRRGYAGIAIVIGFAMSLVAWSGMLMYVAAKLLEIIPRNRHERRLNNLREREEIDF